MPLLTSILYLRKLRYRTVKWLAQFTQVVNCRVRVQAREVLPQIPSSEPLLLYTDLGEVLWLPKCWLWPLPWPKGRAFPDISLRACRSPQDYSEAVLNQYIWCVFLFFHPLCSFFHPFPKPEALGKKFSQSTVYLLNLFTYRVFICIKNSFSDKFIICFLYALYFI